MSSETHSIVALIVRLVLLLSVSTLLHLKQVVLAEAIEDQHHQDERQLHPPLLVHTKHWIRNTEFAERLNWRDQAKPCSLLEAISMAEESAVSMGDSLDELTNGLESNVRNLLLASNGVLLLEESSLDEPLDPMFVKYLNDSGDCTEYRDSELNANQRLFYFEPNPDHLSWFNPDNWASDIDDPQIEDLMPDSHRIPCDENIVVFGSRKFATLETLEANERAKTLSFKVNFKASQYSQLYQPELLNDTISILRIAKLRIGDYYYSQEDFDELIKSETYGDILFQFNNSISDSTLNKLPVITIDESSVQYTGEHSTCLDEAGCLCGNEEENIMKFICSFHEPIEAEELPCLDPISSSGYCDKLCATVVTLTINPTKFSERFLANELRKCLSDEANDRYDYVFWATRRTHFNRYEVTFRHVVQHSGDYQQTLGRERELAQLFYKTLSKDATKTFYGIKSMSIRSSVNWKLNNRDQVFFVSILILFTLASIQLIYIEKILDIDEVITQVRIRRLIYAFRARIAGQSPESLDNEETSLQDEENIVIISPTEISEDVDSHDEREIRLLELESFDN